MRYLILILVFVGGCGSASEDIGSYTCSDAQMAKVQRECEWEAKFGGYEKYFIYKKALERNCTRRTQ